jgi:hypothetical protein
MAGYAQVLIPKVCLCEIHINKLTPTKLSRPKRDHADLFKILKLRYK